MVVQDFGESANNLIGKKKKKLDRSPHFIMWQYTLHIANDGWKYTSVEKKLKAHSPMFNATKFSTIQKMVWQYRR